MDLSLQMMLILLQVIWISLFTPFADKEIIVIPVFLNDKNDQFSLQLCDDGLYNRVYIKKIKNKLSVDKAFNKLTLDNFKGSFIAYINGALVFNTNDAS